MLFDCIWNCVMLKWKHVSYGDNLIIHGRIHLHGAKSKIRIGNNCIITSNVDYNPTAGGEKTHLIAGLNGKMIIGNNVGMSLVNITALEKVEIDDNVLLGAGVKIWDTDFHPISYEARMKGEQAETRPVHICEGAFIGACSIILKGVTIGCHSVVGAGSVVTKDIPDNEVWAGNPAKFIKKVV